MANIVYPHAQFQAWSGQLVVNTADLRLLLVGEDSSILTDDPGGITALDDFTTLDEHTGAGRKTTTVDSWAIEPVSNEPRLKLDPVTWNPLPLFGDPTKDILAALLYVHVTDDSDSYPFIAYTDGGYPVTPTGAIPHTVNFDTTLGAFLSRSSTI